MQAYKEQGVNVWGVSLGNEVTLGIYFGSYFGMPNMVWMPNLSRLFVKKYLGPALKKSGFENTKLYSTDDERPFMNWWSDRVSDSKFS